MRIRSIKPEFFKDEDLCALPPLARILFAGLWCLADCEGRIKDSPKRIKIEVLPYDEVEIDPLLIQLHEHGFIFRYGSNDAENKDRFIQVIHFHRHQRITGKEAESESCIPKFDPNIHVATAGKQRGNNGEAPGFTGKEGKGREGKGTVSDVSPIEIRRSFDRFWSDYPRKVAKEDALRAFKKPDCFPHIELMLSALRRHRDSFDWKKENGKFIPHPATWLNGKRWEDEIGIPSQSAPIPYVPPDAAAFDLQAEIAKKRAKERAEAEA